MKDDIAPSDSTKDVYVFEREYGGRFIYKTRNKQVVAKWKIDFTHKFEVVNLDSPPTQKEFNAIKSSPVVVYKKANSYLFYMPLVGETFSLSKTDSNWELANNVPDINEYTQQVEFDDLQYDLLPRPASASDAPTESQAAAFTESQVLASSGTTESQETSYQKMTQVPNIAEQRREEMRTRAESKQEVSTDSSTSSPALEQPALAASTDSTAPSKKVFDVSSDNDDEPQPQRPKVSQAERLDQLSKKWKSNILPHKYFDLEKEGLKFGLMNLFLQEKKKEDIFNQIKTLSSKPFFHNLNKNQGERWDGDNWYANSNIDLLCDVVQAAEMNTNSVVNSDSDSPNRTVVVNSSLFADMQGNTTLTEQQTTITFTEAQQNTIKRRFLENVLKILKTEKDDIFDILFPRNVGNNHWLLFHVSRVVSTNRGVYKWKIHVYDSLRNPNETIYNPFSAWLAAFLKLVFNENVVDSIDKKESLQQNDAHSCGPMTMLNALYLGMNFKPETMMNCCEKNEDVVRFMSFVRVFLAALVVQLMNDEPVLTTPRGAGKGTMGLNQAYAASLSGKVKGQQQGVEEEKPIEPVRGKGKGYYKLGAELPEKQSSFRAFEDYFFTDRNQPDWFNGAAVDVAEKNMEEVLEALGENWNCNTNFTYSKENVNVLCNILKFMETKNGVLLTPDEFQTLYKVNKEGGIQLQPNENKFDVIWKTFQTMNKDKGLPLNLPLRFYAPVKIDDHKNHFVLIYVNHNVGRVVIYATSKLTKPTSKSYKDILEKVREQFSIDESDSKAYKSEIIDNLLNEEQFFSGDNQQLCGPIVILYAMYFLAGKTLEKPLRNLFQAIRSQKRLCAFLAALALCSVNMDKAKEIFDFDNPPEAPVIDDIPKKVTAPKQQRRKTTPTDSKEDDIIPPESQVDYALYNVQEQKEVYQNLKKMWTNVIEKKNYIYFNEFTRNGKPVVSVNFNTRQLKTLRTDEVYTSLQTVQNAQLFGMLNNSDFTSSMNYWKESSNDLYSAVNIDILCDIITGLNLWKKDKFKEDNIVVLLNAIESDYLLHNRVTLDSLLETRGLQDVEKSKITLLIPAHVKVDATSKELNHYGLLKVNLGDNNVYIYDSLKDEQTTNEKIKNRYTGFIGLIKKIIGKNNVRVLVIDKIVKQNRNECGPMMIMNALYISLEKPPSSMKIHFPNEEPDIRAFLASLALAFFQPDKNQFEAAPKTGTAAAARPKTTKPAQPPVTGGPSEPPVATGPSEPPVTGGPSEPPTTERPQTKPKRPPAQKPTLVPTKTKSEFIIPKDKFLRLVEDIVKYKPPAQLPFNLIQFPQLTVASDAVNLLHKASEHYLSQLVKKAVMISQGRGIEGKKKTLTNGDIKTVNRLFDVELASEVPSHLGSL